MHETLYSNQTGKFPIQSRQGHNYIMVMVKIDSNAIIVETMKTKSDKEMQRAYLALLAKLKRAKIVSLKHILDNECLTSMKDSIRETCKLELVPPGCHQRNVAEVAIKAFKQHVNMYILSNFYQAPTETSCRSATTVIIYSIVVIKSVRHYFVYV